MVFQEYDTGQLDDHVKLWCPGHAMFVLKCIVRLY